MNQMEMRALIVEDDPSWREILTELLQDSGLSVDTAGDLEEATTALITIPHRVVIVDLSLGGSDHHNQDGLKVLAAARQYDPGCTTLLLTGYATVELAVSVLTDHGAYTCLRKETFQRASFRKLLDDILAVPIKLINPISIHKPRVQELQTLSNEESIDIGSRQAIIVEDDTAWRSILTELLGEAGFSVRQCTGFGEALGCFNRQQFDLAVIDLSLSNPIKSDTNTTHGTNNINDEVATVDGSTLLETARIKGTPTIVVSGIVSPSQIETIYKNYEIFAYLEKQGFNRQVFLNAVKEIITAKLAESEFSTLTERERETLSLLSQGLTNKEIAETLVIAPNTVKRHLKAVFEKLGVHTRSAAAAIAIKKGLSKR
jgi:DNA-binding NarL/FixJ family response regulator